MKHFDELERRFVNKQPAILPWFIRLTVVALLFALRNHKGKEDINEGKTLELAKSINGLVKKKEDIDVI